MIEPRVTCGGTGVDVDTNQCSPWWVLHPPSGNTVSDFHLLDTLLLMKLGNYIPDMAQPKHLQALSAATLRLLRPLVRILLRNNVSHRTFAELAKLVYVEVANAEFGIAGKKTNDVQDCHPQRINSQGSATIVSAPTRYRIRHGGRVSPGFAGHHGLGAGP